MLQENSLINILENLCRSSIELSISMFFLHLLYLISIIQIAESQVETLLRETLCKLS